MTLLHRIATWLGLPARSRRERVAVVEECEPRILYSADLNPAWWAGGGGTMASGAIVGAVDATASQAPASATADVQAQQRSRREVVFVDAAVADAQTLIDGLLASQPAGSQIEVVQLQTGSDGLRQISDVLAGEQEIDAIHIVSHGAEGFLRLGNATVSLSTLQARDAELQAWRGALSADADILLYGCDVAAGASGQAFVNQLARLTGADVAASTDLTGANTSDGNWTLELATGKIEAALAIGAQQQQLWQGTLAIAQGNSTSATTAGATSLTWSHTVASGTDGILLVNVAIRANTLPSISAITYGGQALTLIGSQTDSGGKVTSELWYRKAPATGTANIVVTATSSASLAAGATNYFGVDQTTPLGTAVKTEGSGGTPSVPVASAAGEVVIDAVASRQNTGSTIGPGQTQLWNNKSGTSQADAWGASSSEAGAASVAMSWSLSFSGPGEWAAIGVALKPAATSSAPTITNLSGDTLAYSVGSPGTVIEQGGNVAITDIDSANFDSGALTVSFAAGGVSTQDVLAIRNQGAGAGQIGVAGANVTYAGTTIGTWAGGSGGSNLVLTLNANANSSSTAALIQNITYQNTETSIPTMGARTVRFVLSDGDGGTSSNHDTTVNVSSNTLTVVTAAADTSDGDTSSIAALNANKGTDGLISLREAITAANNTAGADTIRFNIAGTGVHTIAPTSALPVIAGQVIIDASTDDSFAANSNRPAIILEGTNAGAGTDGLVLSSTADGSVIRGLVIRDFGDSGIVIQAGSDNNVIAGNYIGRLTTTGTDAGAGTGNDGLGIDVRGSNNTIGGTLAADRNVISGNVSTGIGLEDASASGNTVAGNTIGLTAAGTAVLGNGSDGVLIRNGASSNTIGGVTAAHRNVISGNGDDGVQFSANSGSNDNNVVSGNYIGTDVTGTVDLGNAGDGVDFDDTALNNQILNNLIAGNTSDGIDLAGAGTPTGTIIQGNLIGTAANGSSALGNSGHGIRIGSSGTAYSTTVGGTAGGQGNTIAFNANDGIFVDVTSTSVAILGNAIYGNTNLGINLGAGGVTANDAGDGDTGANNLQNFPALASANSNAAGTTIVGTINSNANTSLRIEFFANRPSIADTPNGEGERYLGFITVTTDGSGNASVNTTLANVWVNSGDRITATATNLTTNDTSEFAANVTASSTGIIVVDTTSDVSDGTTTSIFNLGNARGADGRISLREAVIAANTTANGGSADKIVFNIPLTDANHVYYRNNAVGGTFAAPVATTLADSAITDFDADYLAGTARSWYRISLSGNYLDVTQAVIIDGSTQAGYSVAAGPVIEINAAGITTPGDENAIALTTGASTVRGLVINSAGDNAIEIDVNADNSVIVGNYFGTDVSGTQARGNTTLAVFGALAVKADGVIIGGTTPADRNVISGNTYYGIEIYSSATGGSIRGNTIGARADGSGTLGNGLSGIYLQGGAFNNTIGGTAANQGNLIVGNGGDGVWVGATAGAGNAILGNTIYANTGLAIDLGTNGVTANDANDGDSGANDLLNFPIVTKVVQNGANLDVTLVLDVPAGNYRIELFQNPAGIDATRYGEGQVLLGALSVTSAGTGAQTLTGTLSNVTATSITRISATATRDLGAGTYRSTSEFGPRAGLVVSTTADTMDGTTSSVSALILNPGGDGQISLREAITAANATAGTDTIYFDITAALVGGVHTITLAYDGADVGTVPDALPTISSPVVISGWTEPDYAGNPVIELNGNGVAATKGLNLGAGSDGSTIRGLIINRFTGTGIEISGSNNHTIQGNWIGLNAAGTAASANGVKGIYALNSSGLLIGGTTAAERNIVSGNAEQGIYFENADNSTISGNYVGTNAAGTGDVNGTAAVSTQSGVFLTNGSSGNVIGGLSPNARNVISGNNHYGFEVLGATSQNNLLQGNYIGTDATGLAALGNTNGGAAFWGAGTGNVFGGGAPGARNVIAGNWRGVLVGNASSGATIQGNYIGVAADGLTAMGNGAEGIAVEGGSTGTRIGTNADGTNDTAEGNVIAGNADSGIVISGSGTTGTVVQGNHVGVNVAGTAVMANGGSGIAIWSGAANNTIGTNLDGTNDAIEGNVIAGSGDNGITIADVGTTGNAVRGNLIGVNAAATAVLGNGAQGVWIGAGATNNTIGGTSALAANVIGGSTFAGVEINGAATSGNVVAGNFIGTDASGTLAAGNNHGVLIDGASNNTIGGTSAGAGNLIANNGGNGVGITGASVGNAMLGNRMRNSALLGIDLNNDNVTLNDAGDADSGPNNLQNLPVLTLARTNGSNQLTLNGTLNSSVGSYYRVEFFANTSQDGTGHGEGQTYLGFANVGTDGSGNAAISTTLTVNVAVGSFISATATKSNVGYSAYTDTSELARNVYALPIVQGALVVETTNDVVDGDATSISTLLANKGADGFISLREAVIASNNTSGNDTLNLAAGAYTLTISGTGEDGSATGDIDVQTTITIAGAGMASTIISGGGIDRAIEVDGSGNLTLADVRLTGGSVNNDGGGLLVEEAGGTATLTRVDVTGNTASGGGRIGGGIHNVGTLVMNDSLVHGNTATGSDGGGVSNLGAATITRTAIYANSARYGGGVHQLAGTMTIENATISGNTASAEGGGLDVAAGAMTVRYSTVAANTASGGNGGGVIVRAGTLTALSSIFADNSSTTGGRDLHGTFTSQGYNIIEHNAGFTGAVGTDQLGTDPLLATLALDVASGQSVHALNAGSIAINMGGGTPPSTDQRGVTRDASADVGAFERANTAPVLDNAGTMTLTTIDEDQTNSAGDLVSSIISSAGGDRITDANGDSEGIAITSLVSGNGSWEYSITGGASWVAIGTVSNASALLLRSTDRVRFVPNAANGTSASITIRAWDRHTGTQGTKVSAASNGANTSFSTATETASITVTDLNDAPVLGPIGNQAVNEAATLSFSASATDADLPGQTLSYSLDGASLALGMTINSSTGVFSWTPTEAQGGLSPSVTITVTDNGAGTLTDSETFTITVADTNVAPVLAAIGNRSVNEGVALSFTASATDADLPGQTLSYSLDGASLALGMTINSSTGVFSWTPTEVQGGLSPSVTITVTDNGAGTLADSETFTITVADTNVAPVLAAIGNRSVNEGAALSFTASATDADLPGQTLTYSLDGASLALGMTINASTGVFSWTPTEAQGELTPSVTITVTDNGTGTLTDSETFTITVADTNQAPVLAAIGNRSVNEGVALSFTASATDADLPGQTLSYSLDGASLALGMTINSSTGVFSWTPTEAQGGLSPSVTITVTDNGAGTLTDSETFTITVGDTNEAPVLAAIGNRSVNEGAALSFTASATDADLPGQTLSYSLDGASLALGMTINSSTGVFSWTPTEAQGGLTPSVTVTVTDNGTGTLTDSETFTITVADTNVAPVLAAIGNQVANEGVALSFTASATDADLPSQTLSYSLDGASLALGMTINSSTGVFSWTPTEAQGGLTPSVTMTVTDNGTGNLTDSETFIITVGDTNVAPVLAAIGDRSVNEGAALGFTASATDADLPGQTLSYSLDGASLALGMTINASTGVFSWTPTEAQGGLTPSVTITATDNGTGNLTDSETFTVTVGDTNVAPVLSAIGNRSVNEGVTLSFTASATDADLPSQTLSYSLDGASLALGMTINSATGVFSWTPTEAQGGLTPSVTMTMTDNGTGNLTDSETFTITVADTNVAPVLAAIGNQSASEGVALSFTASATDADLPSQTLSYSLDGASLALGMTINSATGVFSWTPTEAQGGLTPSVTITVTDNGTGNLTDSETFTITVADTNQAPVLAAIGNRSVNEGAALSFTASATDADLPGQTLSYSLDGASLALGMTINSATGVFSWTPTEAQGGLTPSVTVTVTDNGAGNLTDSETFTITVADTNVAPVLAAIGNRSVNEGVALSFTASATDADLPGQSLSYSLDGASLALGMTINASTGVFSWTPTEAQGGLTPSVTVTVSDNGAGTLTDSETFTITVADTNQAPVLAAIGNRSVNEGVALSFTASATDADLPGQTLSYSLDGASLALGMTINSSTGVFSWTPTEAQGSLTPSVTVTVTDNGAGTLADSETFTITVADTNVAPVLAAIGNRLVNEGIALSFTASATDADLPGQSLTYSLDGASLALGMTINSSTGVFSWTPSEAQGGLTPSVTVTVTDNGTGNLTDSESFTITVADTNVAPVLAAIGNRSVNEGVALSFTASATDADLPGQTLSYSLDGASLALGMTINSSTGVFSWTPTETQGGLSPSVTITVTDNGAGTLTDSETFTITVGDTNEAPVLAAIGNQSVNEGVALSFTASATDADLPSQTLSYSLDGASLALGMTINSSTGVFSWTPSETQGGLTPSVTVTVTDNGTGNLADSETFTITVSDTNVAPVLTAIGNQTANEGAALSFTASATDADLPGQTLSYSLDGASLSLGMTINSSTGVFSWTPTEAQGSLTPSVTVTVTDNGAGTLTDSETFIITVGDTNVAPVLAAIGDRSVNEGAALSFTASAADADLPAQSLSYSLDGASLALGMTINSSTGVFSWTPSEAQGGLTPSVTVTVTDNGTGNLTDSETFTITVADTNVAPALAAIGNKSVNEGVALSFTASATDADLPSQTLSYSLDGASLALGMTINSSTGVFSWTPSEAQGGLTPSVTVTVTDNGAGNLTDSETFTITVGDTNEAPVLAAIGNQSVNEGAALSFTVSATDADLPGQTLSYSLDGASLALGMTINASTGVFSWTPTEAQGGLTPSVTVTVTDNGTGNLNDSETISITVADTNVAPVLAAIGNQSASEGVALSFTASATDADLPSQTLSYSLDGASLALGMTINSATGVFSWTPTEAHGGLTPSVTITATDNGTGNLNDSETFTVTVGDTNVAPVLSAIGNRSVNEGVTLSFTASATDADLPGQTLSFSLDGASLALGMTINSATGVFSWTPTEAQGGLTPSVTVTVTDNGTGNLTDSETITITVADVNSAPVLSAIGNHSVNEGVALSFTASATDADLPGQTLSYSLDGASLALGMTINSSTGVFSWTPSETQGGLTPSVTVTVTDNGTGNLTDSETFTITVADTNVAPVLATIGNQSASEGVALSFTASATDADLPSQTLSYSLDGASLALGMTINSSTGVFSWTPTEAQGGLTPSVTVTVTDNGTGNLTDSETFTITVADTNVAPVLAAIGNRSVNEGVALSFTASATDADLPGQTLSYSLDGASLALGMTINSSTGVFSWTPTEVQGSLSPSVTITVTDNGAGTLADSETFTITVADTNVAPVLAAIGNRSVNEGAALSFTASATDADLPGQTLSYSLDGASLALGMTINASTGVFSWTPTEAQGGLTPSVTVTVSDNGTGTLTDSETITITVADTNQAPVLAAIGNRSVNEGVALSFTASATDADLPGQTLSYSLDGASLALGMTINSSTGVFSWTPSEAQGGLTPSVTVTVTDNGTGNLTDSESFTITVADTNVAPVLAAIGNKSVNEGVALSFTASATDADLPSQTLSYSLDGASLALGMTINSSTGVFSWTTSEAQGGLTPSVTVTVTDNGTGNLTDSETFTITVADTNVAPVLAAIGNRSVNEGAALSFTASATDADLPGQTLSYSLDGAAIALGMTINSATGVFSWTPTEAQGGLTPSVTVTVTDNGAGNLTDSETFTITVADTNQAPVLAAIGNQSVNEGAALSFTASATDADLPGQALSYSLDGASLALGMTINASTGVFSWTPTEAQGGLTPSVTVTVTDNGTGNLTDSETITITVADVNSAPVLFAIGNHSVNEGAALSFTASATDADLPSQTLSYSLDGASLALGMTINSSTGVFSWTPSETQGGLTPSVTVTVTDNGTSNLTDSETFTATVGDTNVAPALNAIGNQSASEGVALSFTASATDADLPGQSLTYSLDGASLALGMTIISSTGVFSWTPTETQGGLTPSVTVTVTDSGAGNLTDSETFTITVADTNVAPVLAAIGNRSVNEGVALSFTASATDADLPGQTLSYSLDGASLALGMTINASTGVFSWTPTEAQGGLTPSVTVTVTDNGAGTLTDSETFTITVTDTNQAPVLAAIGNQSVNEGAALSFTASATDADLPGQTLSYSLDGAAIALGMSINSATGVFSWTPTEAQGGLTPSVTITVTDNGTGTLTDSETFTITVADTNQAPVLAAIGNQSVNEGVALSFTASATDADLPSQTLSYSLDGASLALGMTINSATGVFSWTPTEAQGGLTPSVTVTVTDNGTGNLTDSETITITVADVNSAPVLSAIGNHSVNEGAALSFTASATDADLPGQTLSYSLDGASLALGMTINSSTGVFSWTSTEAQGGLSPSVTITVTDNGTGNLTDSETFTIAVPDTNVAPVLANIGNRSVNEGAALSFTASATDADLPGQTLSYSLDGASLALGMTINASTGVFSWTPTEAQGGLTPSVTVTMTDNGTGNLTDSETITITVADVNSAPVLSAIGNHSVNEGAALSFTASATDADLPGQTLSYSLDGAAIALGMTINSSTGVFSWTPTEAQGGLTPSVTVTVTDSGTGNLNDSETLTITVADTNQAPVLAAIGNQSVNEGVALSFTASATDADLPGQTLSYSLDGASLALGMTINANTGVFSWTPTEVQGGLTPSVTVTLTDNGAGNLTDSETFTITVADTNQAPVLAAIGNLSVNEGVALSFTASATDADLPGQTLSYSLDGASLALGMAINASTGVFSWTPTEAQGGLTPSVTITVADNGTGNLTDSETFMITVADTNVAPVMAAIGNQSVNEGVMLSFTASATDADSPGQTLSYSLDGASLALGMSINSSTGVFSWTPTEVQGGLTPSVTITVTDNGTGNLTDSETFTITVAETNVEPVLAAIGNQSVSEGVTLGFTASATDADLPSQTLSYSLDGASLARGMTINASTGVFSWTPTEAQGGLTPSVTITVADNGTGNLTDSDTFTITVAETNVEPVLAAIGNQSVSEGVTLGFTASATDADLPSQTLSFSLDGASLALGMTINASTGVFSWTPTEAQGGLTPSVTVTVTDNGSGNLTDSETFMITVADTNVAPVMAAIGNQSVNEGVTLSFTASATDVDLPGQTLSYSLDGASLALGMSINSSTGVFSWTPTEAQGGLTPSVTVTVTDNGTGNLTDSETFTITVADTNVAPVLAAIGNQSVSEGVTLSFTASATDVDLPGQILNYSLDGASLARGMTINASTGVFSWTPTEAQGGLTPSVTITVTDNGTGNLSDSATFTINVAEVNDLPSDAPVVTGSTTEGQTLTIDTAHIADAVGPGPVSYQWQRNGVNIGGATAPIYTLGDSDVGTTIRVVFFYTDGNGIAASLTSADVGPVANINDAPVITSNGGGLAAHIMIEENQRVVTTVTSSDVDGAAPLYSIVGGADAARFAIDAATGVLSFVIAPDFEAPSDANADKTYDLTVQVSDGVATGSQAVTVAISNTNEAPTGITPARATIDEQVPAGTWVATLSGIDPDDSELFSFTLISDAGGRFVMDASSGRLTVAPGAALDFATQASIDLRVRITDAGGLYVDQTLTVLLRSLSPVDPALPPAADPTPLPPGSLVGNPADATPADPAPKPAAEAPRATVGSPGAALPVASANGDAGRTTGDAGQQPLQAGTAAVGAGLRPWGYLRERDGAEGPSFAIGIDGMPDSSTPSGLMNAALRQVALALRGAGVEAQAADVSETEASSEPSALEILLDPVRVGSVGVTAGVVWWLVRGGGLLTSMLIGVPAWRHLDLLPVVVQRQDRDPDDDDNRSDGRRAANGAEDLDDSALLDLFEGKPAPHQARSSR